VTAVAAAVMLLLAMILPPLYYRRWRYALRAHDLWIRQGLIFHQVSVIPYRRLQFVDTRQGPLERWLGLTELVVHTAAPGTSGRVPGLEELEALRIREALAAFEPGDGDVDGDGR
jgi:membrane protein YdbS with pleckstrin-like domain